MKWAVTTNKGKSEVSIPDGWAAMPTITYMKMAKEWDGKDTVSLFSILSGVSYRALYHSKDRELEAGLLAATQFIYEEKPTFKSQGKPDKFTFRGAEYTVPKDLTGLSIGQNIHVYQRLTGAKTYDELIALALAVYLQPIIDGKDFDLDRALELEKEIERMPITETYPLGFFLLQPLIKSGQTLQKRVRSSLIRWFQDWLRSVRQWLSWQRSTA